MWIDLTSRQFGLLVALRKEKVNGRTKWVCQCRCGKQKIVRQEDLVKGRTKSCGCAALQLKRNKAEKLYGLVNQRFGQLLVLWRTKSPKIGTSRNMKWDCKCDCGRVITLTGTDLRSGVSTNCGCIPPDLKVTETGFAKLLDTYRESAAKRKLLWQLKEARFRELVSGDCYYCGRPPIQKLRLKGLGTFFYNGVDRVDSYKGYVEGNVVSCCATHNRMKGVMTQDQFIEACSQVIEHMRKSNGN